MLLGPNRHLQIPVGAGGKDADGEDDGYHDEDGQDKLIGLVGFTPRQARRKCAEDEDQFAGFDAVINLELGFAVDEKYRRQGYGFAAASAAISYARDHIEHHAIFVNIDPSNQPAIGLAKKLGLME